MKLFLNIIGIILVLLICAIISWDRNNIDWKKWVKL